MGAITQGFENFFKIENEFLIIQKEGLPKVKLYNAINNGDVATVFLMKNTNS